MEMVSHEDMFLKIPKQSMGLVYLPTFTIKKIDQM